MRLHVVSCFLLVTIMLAASAPPSHAATTPASPALRPAAGCGKPPEVQKQDLKTSEYLVDGAAVTGALGGVTGATLGVSALKEAALRKAGQVAAAEYMAGVIETGVMVTYGLAIVTLGLVVGYVYYKYTSQDPPDADFRVIAVPQVRGNAGVQIPDATPAEAGAFNALAANTRQVLAATKALAASQNRATGAAAADAVLWEQRQRDAASTEALHLAALLDAQPALLTGVRHALAADTRPHGSLTVTPSEMRAFTNRVADQGVPTNLVQIAQQLGFTGSDLDLFRSAITSASPSVVAGITFPAVLTSPQIATFDRRGAASWRQFAAGTCAVGNVVHVWSGWWNDSFGGISFRYVSPQEGVGALAQYGAQNLGCAGDAEYYRGGYDDGANDTGKAIACTEGSADHLIGRYVSDTGQTPGDFDLQYGGGSPATWSGTYTPDGGTAHDWKGTFRTHFGGDGCCTVPAAAA